MSTVTDPVRSRLVLAAIVVLAAGLRLAPWGRVYAGDGAHFFCDSDPHYHVLRAARIAADYPHVPWNDPALDYPRGSEIIWPPLFDEAIATAAVAAEGEKLSWTSLERAAAMVPVLFGLILPPLVAALGASLLGGGPWLGAAFFVAVAPAQLRFSSLGRTDQHVLELVLCTWIFLSFASGWRRGAGRAGRFRAAVAVGAGIALSFWNWQGSALYLLVLAAATAAWTLLAPAGDEDAARMADGLALGSVAGALLLVASLAVWGREGALQGLSLAGVGLLQVLMVAQVAAFAGLLLGVARLPLGPSRGRRAACVLAAILLPLAAPMAIPAYRAEIARGLDALAARSGWYADIQEFQPLLLSGLRPWTQELGRVFHLFGLGIPFMLGGVVGLAFRWRSRAGDRPAMLLLASWGVGFLAAALLRQRFTLYAVVPMALLCQVALEDAASLLSRRLPGFGAARSLAWAVGLALLVSTAWPPDDECPRVPAPDRERALRFLGGIPATEGHEAVMASWTLGHAILYYARKPVVASPFGTEGGAGAMEDFAAFYLADDPRAAEGILERRRVGFLVLENPRANVLSAEKLASPGPPLAVTLERRPEGAAMSVGPRFPRLVVSRLFYLDGLGGPAPGEGLTGYRLLYEGPSRDPRGPSSEDRVKIYGVVPGCRLAVGAAEPGRPVIAAVKVRTNQGREFFFRTSAAADARGRATLRLPYASGPNGEVEASDWLVESEGRRGFASPDERTVLAGGDLALDLRPPPRGAPR